jgi:hypothetical protein
MTLVMSLIHAPLAFHVGDRLVTRQEKGRREPWDPFANKSVLVLAQNGYMCISYSGLAYINGKPTDQWLAEAAAEQQAMPGVHGGLATHWDTTLMPRIGPILSRVRAALQTDFARQPLRYRRNGMDIVVAGWASRRQHRIDRQPRPFMLLLRHRGRPDSTLKIEQLPRYWDWSRQLRLCTIGADPGPAKTRLLQEAAQPVSRNQDDYEAMLVKCIRAVADDNDAVGKDCMSILMVRQGIFRVRFLPNLDADLDKKAAYTPWVIAPGVMWPPSVLYGGLPILDAPPYQVTFERVPPLPPSSQVGAYGQPRRPFSSGPAGGQQPAEGNQS